MALQGAKARGMRSRGITGNGVQFTPTLHGLQQGKSEHIVERRTGEERVNLELEIGNDVEIPR
jgi:hypothetical protein